MYRLFRIGLIVTLLALTGSWVGGIQGISAQGTTWTDSMDSSGSGLLSNQSPDPSQFTFGYQNSQFIIQTLQPGWHGDLYAYTSVPELTDVQAMVDFSIAGDLTGKYAFVGCRDDGSGTGYMVEVHPDTGRANIWRYDGNSVENLATVTDTSVVHLGSANNRIEIICQGSTISGVVNGQTLLTAQDSTYTSGNVFIGAGKNSDTTDLLLAGFDNLSVTDLGGSAQPAEPTQPSAFPTAIPAQPTEPAAFPTAIPAEPTAPDGADTGSDGLADPREDPSGALSGALVYSLLATPVAGPIKAQDSLSATDFRYLASGVSLSDLYTSATFVTPPAQPSGSWSAGFAFWWDGQGNYYDLFIQSKNGASKWGYGQQTATGYQILQSGDVAPGAIDFTPGAENYLALVVTNGMALLMGNDFELAVSVDLGGATGMGDVQAEIGFLADDKSTTQTLPVSISSFRVWDLSPAAVAAVFGSSTTETPAEPTQPAIAPTVAVPPVQPTQPVAPTVAVPPTQPTQVPPPAPTAAGSAGSTLMLTQIFNQARTTAMASAPISIVSTGTLQQTTAGFNITRANVALSDFYATVTFVNPSDMSTSSDVGIGFRDVDDDMEYRLVVLSSGEWVLAIGTGTPVVRGTVENFDPSPGASNTIEVVAYGATGLLAINGEVVQQIDLSADLNAGDIWIGTGMYASDSVDGRQVPFANFAVYSLGG